MVTLTSDVNHLLLTTYFHIQLLRQNTIWEMTWHVYSLVTTRFPGELEVAVHLKEVKCPLRQLYLYLHQPAKTMLHTCKTNLICSQNRRDIKSRILWLGASISCSFYQYAPPIYTSIWNVEWIIFLLSSQVSVFYVSAEKISLLELLIVYCTRRIGFKNVKAYHAKDWSCLVCCQIVFNYWIFS